MKEVRSAATSLRGKLPNRHEFNWREAKVRRKNERRKKGENIHVRANESQAAFRNFPFAQFNYSHVEEVNEVNNRRFHTLFNRVRQHLARPICELFSPPFPLPNSDPSPLCRSAPFSHPMEKFSRAAYIVERAGRSVYHLDEMQLSRNAARPPTRNARLKISTRSKEDTVLGTTRLGFLKIQGRVVILFMELSQVKVDQTRVLVILRVLLQPVVYFSFDIPDSADRDVIFCFVFLRRVCSLYFYDFLRPLVTFSRRLIFRFVIRDKSEAGMKTEG